MLLTTLLIAGFLAAAAAGHMVASAGTFPGANGKIAFATGHIEVINADGTSRVTLNAASPASSVNEPAWNATGTKLVYRDSSSSFSTMNADGSNVKPLVSMPSFASNPTWSADGSVVAFDGDIGGIGQENRIYVVPAAGGTATELLVGVHAADPTYSPDGTKIAFENRADGCCDIGIMNADGTNAVTITSGPAGNAGDQDPSWSPDGTKIAFKRSDQIWTMNADGSDPIPRTTGADASYPTWSPDGAKIAFESAADIWVMDSDGNNPTNITNTPDADENEPDWGICTGSGCPPQVRAPANRTLPEPQVGERLRVALQIKLTRAASQPVTVQWAYRDGTATIADGDYEAAIRSGSITIPAGQTSSGDLPYSFIRGDDITEQDETYTVELAGATNAPIADAQTVITILGIAPGCPGYENVPGIHIVGTDGDDNLEGTDSTDVICGLKGNDVITGGFSGDTLDGGPGQDRLFEHGGGNSIYGGEGNDLLSGSGGTNVLNGGDGDDSLNGVGMLLGGNGNDSLTGSDSPDALFGGDGDDHLNGDRGADSLNGGAGDDQLRKGSDWLEVQCPGVNEFYSISVGDVLNGGGGIDTARFDGGPLLIFTFNGWVQVSLDDVANDGLRGTYSTCNGQLESMPIDNVHKDVEGVVGSGLRNRLVGNEKANHLTGGGDRDEIFGGGNDDKLNGGPGEDTLVGQGGDDVLNGDDGPDSLRGHGGDDTLSGGAADDLLLGGSGRDNFNGGAGNDRCDADFPLERPKSCERRSKAGPVPLEELDMGRRSRSLALEFLIAKLQWLVGRA